MDIISILESFDSSPVNWRWIKQSKNKNGVPEIYKALFIIDGRNYEVNIIRGEEEDDYTYEINFFMDGDDQLTNMGSQYKVLSTVIDILRFFIYKHVNVIEEIIFGVQKPIPSYNYAREKVYRRLLNRNLGQLPGDWYVNESGNDKLLVFALINKNFKRI